MPTKRELAVQALLDVFEKAMTGNDGKERFIPKICDSLKKRKFEKDIKRNRKSIEKILDDFTKKIANPGFWKGNRIFKNNHGADCCGTVGKEKVPILKRSTSKADRIYFIRYTPPNGKTYVELLGYQLSAERDKDWRDEVRDIISTRKGEIYPEEKTYDEEEFTNDFVIGYNSEIIRAHAGYLINKDSGELILTENVQDLLLNDANIVVTNDQFEQIAEPLPLLIDGHAGTGKSIIIGLRVAFQMYHFKQMKSKQKNNQELSPSILVVAYSKRVLEMIKQYSDFWMKLLIGEDDHEIYSKYIDYKPTLELYHSLLKEHDYENIPNPTEVKALKKILTFSTFDKWFFRKYCKDTSISAEQLWHFIRGILKGRRLGWHGSERITLQDFASFTGEESRIPRKVTESMSTDLIRELIELHYRYEKWRTDKNFLDDTDLVRKAFQAIESSSQEERPKRFDLLSKYDSIFVDEGQDLSVIEFDLLQNLLTPDRTMQIGVGGDPLQTINPTGFSWDNLMAFITKAMIEKGVKKPEVSSTKMTLSHRMPLSLVNFANQIIRARSRIGGTDYSEMEALESQADGTVSVVTFDAEDPHQEKLLSDFLNKSIGSNIGVVLWAKDRSDLEQVKNKDEILVSSSLNYSFEMDGVVDIHSIESVKGLEFSDVILYRFSELSDTFAENINKAFNRKNEQTLNKADEYEILYFLNQLFIAATRGKNNVYIIDSEKSKETVWNQKYWDSTINASHSLENFLDTIQTEPTLEKAKTYYERGKEKFDTEILYAALLSATQCPPSEEQTKLKRKITITILELEIQDAGLSVEVVDKKRHQLVELYEEMEDLRQAIIHRVELKQWKMIYDKYQNVKDPWIMNIWRLAAYFTTKNPDYLETLMENITKIDSNISAIIKKQIRSNVADLTIPTIRKALKAKILSSINVIDGLKPKWLERDPTSAPRNSKLLKQYEKSLEDLGLNEKSLTPNEFIRIVNIKLGNPNCSNSDKLTEKLSELGDTSAIKKQISKIYNREKPNLSIDRTFWLEVSSLAEKYEVPEDTTEREQQLQQKLNQRLKDISRLINATRNFTTFTSDLKMVSGAIKRIIANPETEISSKIPIIHNHSDNLNLFNHISEISIEDLSKLTGIIISRMIENERLLRKFLESEDLNSISIIQQFDSVGNESKIVQLSNKIVHLVSKNLTDYDSNLIKFMIKYVDKETSRHLGNKKKSYSHALEKLLTSDNSSVDFSLIWKEPGVIHHWVTGAMSEDATLLYQFHRWVAMMKSNNISEADLKKLSALVRDTEICKDSELRIEILQKSGEDEKSLLKDSIITLNKEACSAVNQDELFTTITQIINSRDNISWDKTNWFDGSNKLQDLENLELDTNSIFLISALKNHSFAQTVLSQYSDFSKHGEDISSFLQNKSFWESARDKLDTISVRLLNENQFWEMARRDNSLFDSLSNPSKRKPKQCLDLFTLALLDIMIVWCSLSADKDRTLYLHKIGLLSRKSYPKKADLISAVMESSLFKTVIEMYEEDVKALAKTIQNSLEQK